MTVDLGTARDWLLAERERVAGEIAELQGDLGHSMEDAVDEDGNDSHLADSATETLDRGIELSLEDNASHLLASIDGALQRLDEGTYGRCENCGNPIPKARLQAFPRATLDVACKQREERR